MRKSLFITVSFAAPFAICLVGAALAQAPDQISAGRLAGARHRSSVVTPHSKLNGQAHARQGVSDVDSVPNFNGHFFAPGFDPSGNPNTHWYFNTLGNPPQMHGTTSINAPVIAVSLDLRDASGNPRFIGGNPLVSDATQFVPLTLNSPVFSNATYTSSPIPTQFSDAVQRAEYAAQAKDDWHTLLAPSVKTPRTMVLNQSSDLTHPAYLFALNGDGTCCLAVLVDGNTFVAAFFNIIVDAINAGDITTKDVSTFLFPNTLLFLNGDPNQCCVVGFHTYVFDDSNPKVESRWVLNYSSWVTPGLLGGAFQDITALSHEISETYNDPFLASDGVHDVTPWWLSPNGNCQDALETGDVIEGLPNATFPVTINNVTYFPQNEALLQWFEFMSPSNALGGAYSYPDTTVLTGLSAPQKPGCQ